MSKRPCGVRTDRGRRGAHSPVPGRSDARLRGPRGAWLPLPSQKPPGTGALFPVSAPGLGPVHPPGLWEKGQGAGPAAGRPLGGARGSLPCGGPPADCRAPVLPQDSIYIFREGALPPYRQMFYQLCDLNVDEYVRGGGDGTETPPGPGLPQASRRGRPVSAGRLARRGARAPGESSVAALTAIGSGPCPPWAAPPFSCRLCCVPLHSPRGDS